MAEERFGIDFGTSTTLAARGTGGGEVIPLGLATRWTPTVASIASGVLTTGDGADADPEWSVVRSVKSELLAANESVSRRDLSGEYHVLAVDDVIRAVLSDVRSQIELAMGQALTGPIHMACPAIWTAEPRRRLQGIAEQLGLDVTLDRIIDEPIAAGISWVMDRFRGGQPPPEGRTVVFDYGGGTLDVAVLEVNDVSPPEITVLAASGLSEAGDTLDGFIQRDLVQQLAAEGHDFDGSDSALEVTALLRLAARNLKMRLTTESDAATGLPGRYSSLPELRYTRSQLEGELDPMLRRAMRVVEGTLRSAELRARNASSPAEIRAIPASNLCDDVRHVLLAGGMSQIPLIRQRMTELFPNASVGFGVSAASRPEEAIVRGLVQPDAVVSELNLHRPGFDFKLCFRGADDQRMTQTVYSAYSPLYSPSDVASGKSDLGYHTQVCAPTWARTCALRCESVDGTALQFRVADRQLPEIDMPIARDRKVAVKLYADGRLLLRGSRTDMYRVERWPHIRSRHGATVSLVPPVVESTVRPDLGPGWFEY